MKPTVGRIVHYRLTEQDAEAINRRRVAKPREPGWPAGAQAHAGNYASAGAVLPMIVTAVWPDEYAGTARLAHHPDGTTYAGPAGVNGQVLLDGTDSLWVTSAPEHSTLPGTWCWPPRE